MPENMKTFIGSLPIVAKAIGRRYGVHVKIGGARAFTDGNVIHLPALPEDDPQAEVLVNGYLDHEAAHCRFTDFTARHSSNVMQRWLENALEDIRIESLIGRYYPGCRRHLARLVEKLMRDGDDAPLKDDASEAAVLSAYVLRRLRYEVLGQDALEELAVQASERFEAMFPKGLGIKLTAIMAEIRGATSTREAIAIAARIRELLNDEAEEPPESNSDGQATEGRDGEDSLGQSDASSGSDSHDGDDAESGNAYGADDADADAEGSNSDGTTDKSRRQALQAALEGGDGDFEQDIGGKVASKLEDAADPHSCPRMAEADDEVTGAGGDPAGMDTGEVIDETAVRQATARLRSRLAGLIQTETLVQTPRSRAGKRIDRRMLPRLGLADPRVFRSETEETRVDTAVTVLLDRSGSMRGAEIVVAREAALAVEYAFEEIEGVSPSVFAFPGSGGDNRWVRTLHRRGRRVQPRRFGISAGGGTPLTEAARFAGWDLLTASEPRKILIVITDGHPDDFDSAADVLARMRASGIETLGIGIHTGIQPKLIPESRQIDAAGELAGALFDLLERKLATEVAV